jgi:membrane protease YdiL (CAAX protease family)
MNVKGSIATVPESKVSWGLVIIFLLLLTAFSAVFNFLILRSHKIGGAHGLYAVGIMWCSGLAAITTLKLNGRKLSELGWRWPQPKYAFVSWAIPLSYTAIAYTIIWCSGMGRVPNRDFMQQAVTVLSLRTSPLTSTVIYILLTGSLGIIGSMSHALGEEIGWRGFLVPELSRKMGFTNTALFSGAVWTLVHYPVLIWADYNSGTPIWYALICFSVMTMSLSFIFAWMRLKSGSLWTGAILHASHNLYIQAVFTPLTRDTGKTAWFIDEFGLVLPVVVTAFAIYFWRRRHELNPTAISK